MVDASIKVGDKGTRFQAVIEEEDANGTHSIIDLSQTDQQVMQIVRPGRTSVDEFTASIIGPSINGLIEYKNTNAAFLDKPGQIKWRGKVRFTATQDIFYGEWIYDKVTK